MRTWLSRWNRVLRKKIQTCTRQALHSLPSCGRCLELTGRLGLMFLQQEPDTGLPCRCLFLCSCKQCAAMTSLQSQSTTGTVRSMPQPALDAIQSHCAVPTYLLTVSVLCCQPSQPMSRLLRQCSLCHSAWVAWPERRVALWQALRLPRKTSLTEEGAAQRRRQWQCAVCVPNRAPCRLQHTL